MALTSEETIPFLILSLVAIVGLFSILRTDSSGRSSFVGDALSDYGYSNPQTISTLKTVITPIRMALPRAQLAELIAVSQQASSSTPSKIITPSTRQVFRYDSGIPEVVVLASDFQVPSAQGAVDTDHDGVLDIYDFCPSKYDCDGDGINDGNDLYPLDNDNDMINDRNEPEGCAQKWDCDGDGLADALENPACITHIDCDGDGLLDPDENPSCVRKFDCDTDGVQDIDEDPGCVTKDDCDGDGLFDNKDWCDTNPDCDGDGIKDVEEVSVSCSVEKDCDKDSVLDKDEVSRNCIMNEDCDNDGINDADDTLPIDHDNDGLIDQKDPDDNDTDFDNDGLIDGKDPDTITYYDPVLIAPKKSAGRLCRIFPNSIFC